METRPEILAWLRVQIADHWAATPSRSGSDGGAFFDGFGAALQWVADELDMDEEPAKCS